MIWPPKASDVLEHAQVHVSVVSGTDHEAGGISDGQKRILYGAFLAFHGILFSHVGSSSTTGAELLPLVVATLATRASAEISGDFSGGDTRGLHATALRIAALGANESPWGERGGAPLF